MQLKVNYKYKRIGTQQHFSTKTGEIIQITEITKNGIRYVNLSNPVFGSNLSLSHIMFKQEYKLIKNIISFKGLL